MSLEEYLTNNPGADRVMLLQQVAIALATLHNGHQVVNGEIKMENVRVAPNGDIEFSKSTKLAPITSEPRPSTSTEERLPSTTATDVYAFAWLAFHVFTDIDPRDLARDPKAMRSIASGSKPNRPGRGTLPEYRGLDDRIWDMFFRCWEIQPDSRPSMDEVLYAFGPPTAFTLGLNAQLPSISYPADLRFFWTEESPYVLQLSEPADDTVHVLPPELVSFWQQFESVAR